MILQIEKDGTPIHAEYITVYINGKQFRLSSTDNETLVIEGTKANSEVVTKIELS